MQQGQVFKLKQVGGFATRVDALKALENVLARIGPGGQAAMTLAELVDEYLEMHAGSSGAGHGKPTMSWADHTTPKRRNVVRRQQDGEPRSDPEPTKRRNVTTRARLSPFRQSATTAHFDTSRANYCLPLPALRGGMPRFRGHLSAGSAQSGLAERMLAMLRGSNFQKPYPPEFRRESGRVVSAQRPRGIPAAHDPGRRARASLVATRASR